MTAPRVGYASTIMSTIRVQCLDATRCVATHEPSGAELVTDIGRDYGGGGTSFSSTDLVGVALATCIGSSLSPVLLRNAVALEAVEIRVEKTLATEPKRIARLALTVALPPTVDAKLHKKLTHAARTCTVHRSLHGIDVEVRLLRGNEAPPAETE